MKNSLNKSIELLEKNGVKIVCRPYDGHIYAEFSKKGEASVNYSISEREWKFEDAIIEYADRLL